MATNNAINQVGILPSFMAVNNADQTNVTGDATNYIVQFTNESYDITNSYDAGTGIFTAPLTGTYLFTVNMFFLPEAATYGFARIVTTGEEFRFWQCNTTAGFPFTVMDINESIICRLSAGHTARVEWQMGGTTKTIDLIGATAAAFNTPLFSGYMIAGI